jgi:hypothetical protein
MPNLPYRVVCYTTAWIDLLVPFTLNFMGLAIAAISGKWMLAQLYFWLYYPLALLIVGATWMDCVPRARLSTANEGSERAWFYVTIWMVIASQFAGWILWRLGARFNFPDRELAQLRLAGFVAVSAFFVAMGLGGKLGRTERYIPEESRKSQTASRKSEAAG